mgnify:FL=1
MSSNPTSKQIETLKQKHNDLIPKTSETRWEYQTHYCDKNYSYCGQSCVCCRAKLQQDTGEIEFGACVICLGNQ